MRISKKVFEPGTDTIDITSEHLTEAMMLTSKQNNEALEKLGNKNFKKWEIAVY